jgi:lipid-binding SYLF domain-containing protein
MDMIRKALWSLALAASLTMPAGDLFAANPAKKRAEIDKNFNETLSKLYKEQPSAKTLVNSSYGYAVFHCTQTALMISGGGGSGVAVETATGKRTYMRMGSAGAGVGVGIQVMDVVFVFETKDKFRNFVDKGFDADASGSAAAGNEGMNKRASFTNGVAVFQMTDKGLIAQASLKGTKYWQDDKLNARK